MITACEACTEDAELPFDNILDRLTGSDPSVTDYVLEVPTRCLQSQNLTKWLSFANLHFVPWGFVRARCSLGGKS
jgi:hypothetical protein